MKRPLLLPLLLLATAAVAQVGPLEFCTVVGRVTDEHGTIVKGVMVELRPAATDARNATDPFFAGGEQPPDEQMTDPRRDKDVFAWGKTDDEGWFRIEGVKKPGAYMLLVRGSKQYRETRAPLSIAASVGPEFRADLTLRPFKTGPSKGEEAYAAAILAAQAAEREGSVREAIGHLEVAVQLEPDSPVPHYHLARIALAQGDLKKADKEAGLAVSRRADCTDCWVMRAKVERAAKNLSAARTAAEKALALNASNAEAHGIMGLVLYDQGQFAAALAELEGAVAAEDPDPNVHLFLANAYMQLKKPQLALATYKSFLKRFPDASNRTDVERVIASLE